MEWVSAFKGLLLPARHFIEVSSSYHPAKKWHHPAKKWSACKQGQHTFWFLHLLTVKCVKVAQSCPTLCNPMDCSPPGSTVRGILQARVLEWVAIPFSRGSSETRDWTRGSCTIGRFLTVWAPRGAHLFINFTNISWASIMLQALVQDGRNDTVTFLSVEWG